MQSSSSSNLKNLVVEAKIVKCIIKDKSDRNVASKSNIYHVFSLKCKGKQDNLSFVPKSNDIEDEIDLDFLSV